MWRGGQVEPGESFDEAVVRKLKEELGVVVDPIHILKTYETPIPGLQQKVIPGVRYVCGFMSYVHGNGPKISEQHSECRWQPVEELDGLEFIPGLAEDITEAHLIYKRLRL